MKKILLITIALLMLLPLRSGLCASYCEDECDPGAMKNMVEGKVAQMNCLQACRQRKVWEQMVLAIDRLTVQLAETARNQQGTPATATTSGERVNFEEVEPRTYKSGESGPSFQFGSVTPINPSYTNTTLVSPTIIDATFKNSTQ